MWQGCVLSLNLFSLYTEKIFNESDELPGCIVGGENFKNQGYADDTALLAESESALQRIVDVVRQNSEEKGLSMNVKKVKRRWYVAMKHINTSFCNSKYICIIILKLNIPSLVPFPGRNPD